MTDASRWTQIEEIFHEALELPENEREAWLDARCGGDAELRAEVASLIASDREAVGSRIGSEVKRAFVQFGAGDQQQVEGRRFGPYRLIRELGRGGMGAVYLAARDDQQYESEVAIKLVRPGLDTDFILRRFRRERQILARLQHPNIARLLDGGTADDGTPYLVMEYIRGTWITKYAAEKELTVDERLRLFLPVCAAVEHAHRHFIVHRDLKPGNILIDESGAPKLLDFGVSKLLLSDQTDPADTQGVGMITPAYASPEQVLGDPVTVVSDVYSLGAVLYELLSGVGAHRIEQCTPLALERAICLDQTIAPSDAVRKNATLSRRLRGDLDNIILRAMQKQPERRYLSVEQFEEDLRRHLEHRPVMARPDSVAYRMGKFLRRNRVVVAMGSLFVTSFIVGTAAALHEANIAQDHFQQVRKLATTFVFDVEESVRELPGSRPVRQLIAKTGLEYLGNLSRSSERDWDLKRELATAYIRIGELQGGTGTSNLGDLTGAMDSFRNAQALLDAVLQHAPGDRKAAIDRMMVSHRMSNTYREMGQTAPATDALEDGLRRSAALLTTTPGDYDVLQYASVFHLDLARMRQQSGDLSRAAEETSTAIPLLKKLTELRPDNREDLANLASSHARLGAIQAELGRKDEALSSYREGVTALENILKRFPDKLQSRHELMLAYSHVGDTLGNPAYDNFGDEAGAREAYAKMAEIAEALQRMDPGDVRATSDYGIALLRMAIVSPPDTKRAGLEKAHEYLTRALPPNSKDRGTRFHKAWNEVELGDVLLAAGDHKSSGGEYRAAIATFESGDPLDPTDSSSHRWLILAARKLAEEQVRSGDREGALAVMDKTLELAKRIDAAVPKESVTIRAGVARAWQAAGSVYAMLANKETGELRKQDRTAAFAWYRRSMDEWRTLELLQGFNALRRKEMNATVAELAALEAHGDSR